MSRRLLFIVNQAGYFLSHRLPLAVAARGAGWEVEVATAASPAQAEIRAAGFPAHQLPLSRSGARPDQELRAVFAALRLLRARRPDLVHCVALKATVIGGLAARLAGAPATVFAIAGLGHVFTDHSVKGRLLRLLFRRLLLLMVAPSCRVIVQNQDDLSRLGVNPRVRERSVLIPGAGVDLNRFRPEPEPPDPVTVVLPSRMIETKGIGEFVAAARLLREQGVVARFLLAGAIDPGNPAAIPEARLAQWNREGNVVWLGQQDDMPDLLAKSHIVCLPSYYGEGVPKSLIEAAAAGRPAVASDMPGCRDVVRNDENGLLVPPKAPGLLAEALKRLIEDPALRRRFGARGREIAEREFGLDRVIAETLALYRELLP